MPDRIQQLKVVFLACGILISGFANELKSQAHTDGELTFTVTTNTANGNFSPKHVLAIWVEDESGFVLTRKLRGDRRKQYLYTWNNNTGGNVVDATTGATLSSHQEHTVVWDCRDTNGDLVPDGEYSVYVEFTEAHAQGPLKMVSFQKGTASVSLNPADETNFKGMELVFEPSASTGIGNADKSSIKVFPNPTDGIVMLDLNAYAGDCHIRVSDVKGSLIYDREILKPGSTIQIDISEFASGTYFMQVVLDDQTINQTIIKE